ncbi:hypothetical protein BU17DRAFT_91378 [Hysterangium stoloniferum]|nr:hypothetical protein BU17DRAFT_91378 [Hysterangium stoloniferum]
MLDLTKPAQPTGGKRFYYLARAALALEPLFERPTLTAVQAIMLMLIYLSMSDHKDASELAYILSGINLKLSLALGLHREWRKFNLNQQSAPNPQGDPHVPRSREEELRRVIFLEVVHYEAWLALQFGRPSLLHFSHFDCSPPGTVSERNTGLETRHMKSQAWTYTFLRKCLIPTLNYAVAVKPPPYSDIMKLDAIVRNYNLPEVTQIPFYEEDGIGSSESGSRAAVTLRFSVFSQKDILLLYLHRPYFAFAMTDYSIDPLGCPFLPSVLACFRASCGIVAKMTTLFEQEPGLSPRIWIFWNQLFVPCILGTIVVRSPGCKLAPTALAELDKICELLLKAKEGFKPSTLLPHAHQLREKAHSAYNLHYSSPGMIPPAILDISEELMALGGKSRVSPATSAASSPESQQQVGRPFSSPPTTDHVPSSLSPDTRPSQPEQVAEPPVISVPSQILPTVKEMSHFASHDWGVSDIDSLIMSDSGISEQTPLPQNTFDGNLLSPDNAGGFESTEAWWNELNTLYQAGSLISHQEQVSYPILDNTDMQPTWQNFMSQVLDTTTPS